MHRRTFPAVGIAGAVAFGQLLQAADDAGDKPVDKDRWGDLTATFVHDGEPPERKRLKVDKDLAVYKEPIFDPSLIVDPRSKGIANVVAWLHVERGASPPAIHPGYQKSAQDEIVLDTVRGNIEPHVCLLRGTQTLHCKNSEPIGHNHRCDLFPPPNIIPASGSQKLRLKPESSSARPAHIWCTIHPWENGYILVRDHPYMAVSDARGKLVIKNLPVGTHTFTVWHEMPGFLVDVKRDGKAEKWKRGQVKVQVKVGENDLGVVLRTPKHPKD